jgi:hypothetical protein
MIRTDGEANGIAMLELEQSARVDSLTESTRSMATNAAFERGISGRELQRRPVG